MNENFDWENDRSVVARHQSAIAVYRNHRGSVTLRDEEGTIIEILPETAEDICRAIIRQAGLHDLMILPVDTIAVQHREGHWLQIPNEVLAKLNRITEDFVREDAAKGPPEVPARRSSAKDPTAAARKRRQRERARGLHSQPAHRA